MIADNKTITLGLVGPRDFRMMHFSRDQAGVIGRELTRFAETCALGESGEETSQILQSGGE